MEWRDSPLSSSKIVTARSFVITATSDPMGAVAFRCATVCGRVRSTGQQQRVFPVSRAPPSLFITDVAGCAPRSLHVPRKRGHRRADWTLMRTKGRLNRLVGGRDDHLTDERWASFPLFQDEADTTAFESAPVSKLRDKLRSARCTENS